MEHVPAEQEARSDREQDGETNGNVFGAHGQPQNFSGRSIAYTRYANAATLNDNDTRVMGSSYTRSQSVTNPTNAANVAIPRITIPTVNMGDS
jgi:hypothetical protein